MKLLILRSLKTKRSKVVSRACSIHSIILSYIYSAISQSQGILQQTWYALHAYNFMRLQMVHGKPRHRVKLYSIEWANQDTKIVVTTWMQSNQFTL